VRRLREKASSPATSRCVDPVKVSRSLIIFASPWRQRRGSAGDFERKMMRHPEVMQCYFVSGDADYLVVSASATWPVQRVRPARLRQ
jgi:Lrp/AsnC family leucine-responsive transcriptional regulator